MDFAFLADCRRLLAARACASQHEERHRAACLALCEAGPQVIRRDHFAPGHFTASAFVADPSLQRLLLVRHRKLQRWLQPGGHIEAADADPRAAARREAAEECDLRPDQLDDCAPLGATLLDIDVHDIPAIGSEPAHQHFDLRFLFTSALEVRSSSDPGILALRWWPLDGLEGALLAAGEPLDSSVARAAASIRGLRHRGGRPDRSVREKDL